jgi:hypothetical protein
MYTFIRVKKDNESTIALYRLLKRRAFNISQKTLPSFEKHKAFVFNHPYRIWYLIKLGNEYVGTVYLLKNNCLGIYLANLEPVGVLSVIKWILQKHKPLPEIKSVRAANYHINVPFHNMRLREILEENLSEPIQITYSIDEAVKNVVFSEDST